VAYFQSTGSTVIGTSTITIANGQVGIGTATFTQPLTVNGNVDVMGKAVLMEIANSGTTGTTVNSLAKLASGAVAIGTTGDTDGMVGVVVGETSGGTSGVTAGNAQIAVDGQASCTFDGATTAGDYATISTTTVTPQTATSQPLAPSTCISRSNDARVPQTPTWKCRRKS